MSRKRNTFSTALKHLKTDRIVEAAPTNNTLGVMVPADGDLTRVIDKGTQPDFAGVDWEVNGSDGKDTSGLFDGNGDSLFIGPPGDNSYILGPMSAMFYNYSSYDWTMIGYIREADRRFVNLGYIMQNKTTGSEFDGKLSDWDGVNNFTSYGQLTLEQALWFRDTQKKDNGGNDPDGYNYRAFYPGPPSSTPDQYGRYLCCITGTPKASKQIDQTVAPLDQQGSDNLSAIIDKVSKGQKLSKAEKALLNKSRGVDWDKVGKVVNTALTIADVGLMVASLIGILIPEPTTSAAGAAGLLSLLNKFRLANRLRKGQGLARGLRNMRVGATGLKSQGFRAIKGGALHKGSKGILSPGGGGVYSATTVGKVGRSSLRPGTGASRYVKYKSNPLAKGGSDAGGGVVGSIVPGGARRIGGIEPQAVVNQRTFQKGNKLFNKVMGGQYKNSATANRIRSMAKNAGFNPGQANISLKNLLRMNYEYAYNYYLIESSEDQQDLMIIQLMDNPKFVKRLPEIISGFEDEADLIQILDMMGGIDDGPGELHPDNPLSTEDDPWALKKQQTQEGVNLSEDKKTRIMKSLKEPVVLPETKQKSYKVSPGKRNKTNFQGMDKLVGDVKPQSPFKRTQDIWSKDWQGYNSRLSQDKKNRVLEKVGDGKLAFNYMLTDSKIKNAEEMEKFWGLHPEMYSYFYNGKKYKALRKEEVKGDYVVFMEDENGVKSNILQSELNLKLSEEHEKQLLDEYNKLLSEQEPVPYLQDPLMKKVAKRLKNEIDYEGKPAVKGYPNEPPPQMVKGFHPEYGKKYKYDKLDPVSAVAMRGAPTGNPEIDANVEKAAKKVKPKVKEDYSDWREDVLY